MAEETPERKLHEEDKVTPRGDSCVAPAVPINGRSVRVEPDLEFISELIKQGGDAFKKCLQCGTCSGTCDVSPDDNPFPRKEMAWANWGLKDRLVSDPDAWLCYQCNDCSLRCPCGAKPGELLGVIRQMSIRRHAFPGVLGRWVNKPHCALLAFGIPAMLLAIAAALRKPLAAGLGFTEIGQAPIVFTYSSHFPQWLLYWFFGLFTGLSILASAVGLSRFWAGMKQAASPNRLRAPAKTFGESLWTVVRDVFWHKRFDQCSRTRSRFITHALVVFGFIALTLVTIWVAIGRFNPWPPSDFFYPFGFFNPWKVLANLGGVAVAVGCCLMIRDRLRERDNFGIGGFFDYALIITILLVILTGFGAEALHYLRLEPHRHVVYYFHLVFALALIIYLPYSKLAHMLYRTAALVFVERYGRGGAEGGRDHG